MARAKAGSGRAVQVLDAEKPGRLTEREPFAVVTVRHRWESGQSCCLLHLREEDLHLREEGFRVRDREIRLRIVVERLSHGDPDDEEEDGHGDGREDLHAR